MIATVVFGGQAGSEGKGAIVGYLARREKYKVAICNFMTNAGHTWVDDNGNKVVVQQLPVSLVSPDIEHLCIGPGSAITEAQLEKELNLYDRDYNISTRLRIHPRAVIIDPIHREMEQDITKRVASTLKGCGTALADKTMRHPRVRLARDVPWMKRYIADTTQIVNDALYNRHDVMVEGAQGFDLDINHGIEYPYCTSRQCTPAQALADSGIPPQYATRIIAVIRTYPIRVGNIVENGEQVGYSGPFGGAEVTFEEIAKRAGYPEGTNLAEYTTVTGRMRRIFEMDYDRIKYMVQMTGTTELALTFADYLDHRLYGWDQEDFLWNIGTEPHKRLTRFVSLVEDAVRNTRSGKVLVNYAKTGPLDKHMIEM